MKPFQTIINNLSDWYTRYYLLFGIVTGVLVFLLVLLYKPQMWLVGLLAGTFFGWANGLVGYAILGMGYIVVFVLYPFVRLFTNKEYAKRLYHSIDGKEALQSIVLFLMILFPTIWMICESFGRSDTKTTISSIAAYDEKGLIENTNKLIRQYIPSGTDFSTINDDFLLFVPTELNLCPRKLLNFSFPQQKNLLSLHNGVAFRC